MPNLKAGPGQKIHTNRDGTQALIPISADVGVYDIPAPGGSHSSRYISPTAIIGEQVIVRSGAKILAYARVGDGADVQSNVTVAPYAVVPSYWIIPELYIVNRNPSQDENAIPILINPH